MDRLRRSSLSLLLLLILTTGILYQGWNLIAELPGELQDVRGTIGQSGLWRSAYFFQGERFADFIKFIHLNTPEDARIVLPPQTARAKALSTTPVMQFFLAPRQVINCPDLACLKSISPQDTYFIILDSSQAAVLATPPQQLRMLDQGWGIIVPGDPHSGDAGSMPEFTSLVEIFQAAFWPAIWLVILTASGTLLLQRLAPGLAFLARASLGYGLALGSYTLLVSLASLAGLPIGHGLLLGLTGLLFLSSLAIFLLWNRPGKHIDPTLPQASPHKFSLDIWPILFLLLGIAAALISVGKGFHTTDEILLWGAKGYGIAADRTIRYVTAWGTNTVPYPLHIPLLIANFRILFSEILPASKLLFAGYYLGLLLLVYTTLLHLRVPRWIAGLGTLFLASTPLVFRHATIAYANLALSYYLVAAVSMLALTLETKVRQGYLQLALLSGLLFVLAAWTRPEGLILSWLCLGLVLSLSYLRKWESFSPRKAVLLIAPLGIYTVFWWIVKWIVYSGSGGEPNLASAALAQVIKGNFHLNEALYVLQTFATKLASPGVWGVLGMGVVVFVILTFFLPSRPKKASTVLIISGLLSTVLILGIYYLTSFDSTHDLSWWVSTGLDRMLLPAILLLWLGALSRVQLFDHGE